MCYESVGLPGVESMGESPHLPPQLEKSKTLLFGSGGAMAASLQVNEDQDVTLYQTLVFLEQSCIYIYVHICIFVYIHACTHIYIHPYMCVYVYLICLEAFQ